MDTIFILGLYTTIIVVFIWSRFRYFRSDTNSNLFVAMIYDPAVILFVCVSYYHIARADSLEMSRVFTGSTLLVTSFCLYVWSLRSTHQAKLAFNLDIKKLNTTGAYGFVRHPFYLSYSLTWCGIAIICNYTILNVPLVYLLVFYWIAARIEEKSLLNGARSSEYNNYKQNVGMFFPRVTQWINCNSER